MSPRPVPPEEPKPARHHPGRGSRAAEPTAAEVPDAERPVPNPCHRSGSFDRSSPSDSEGMAGASPREDELGQDPDSEDGAPGTARASEQHEAAPRDGDPQGTEQRDTEKGAGHQGAGHQGAGRRATSGRSAWQERFQRFFRRTGAAEENPVHAEDDESVGVNPVRAGFGLAVGAIIAVGLWTLLTNLTQLLLWIAVALFIALGLDPIVRFFERRNWPRVAGVGIVVLLLLALAGAFLGTLIPALITQITQLVQRTPDIITAVTTNPTVRDWDAQFHLVDQAQKQLNKFLQDSSAVGGVFNGVINVGSVVAQFATGLLIILVLALYFLISLPSMKRYLYSLVPRSRRRRTRELTEQITASVGNYVIGQATVAAANAVYAYIIMNIVHTPYAALLALCVAVLAFIPLVGGVLAGVLVILVTLFSGGWQAALVYAICYFAYLQLEAYLISPRIMARAVKVPGAVAVIAVVAGGSLLGVVGALMAIPVAAALLLLVREIWVRRQDVR